MDASDGNAIEPLVEPVTRREREVLALLAEGQTAPEIAQTLGLAESSVRTHIQHLYGKLGVSRRHHAVARAREMGLLPPAPGSSAAAVVAPPEPKHNLPLAVTRFFGREADIEQVLGRLADNRLVTLTGAGGVGKTRLAVRVAEEVLAGFQHGVWLAELAALTNPGLLAQVVAASLGLRDEPGRPVVETLTHHLRARQALLVLDNCEHLLAACARLADGLLRNCPALKLLATSRELLGVAGEAILAVPSLPFPAAGALPADEYLTQHASVRLFLDRAQLVRPDYAVQAHNAPAIGRICRRLDGIPLAIEMAAARMNTLSAGQLADRLDDAFGILTGGSRTALPRQQTLRATLDWSYDLLSGEQRRLLQRLSVFAGGCTLEAVETVCADPPPNEGLPAGAVLAALTALVSKSMVTASRQPGEPPRYHLLETVRQYAQEKLAEAGETLRVRTRHRDYFLVFAETHAPLLAAKEQNLWSRRLTAEIDNFRAALAGSFSDLSGVEAGPQLLRFCFGWPMWGLGFSHQEQLDWYNKGSAWCQGHTDVSASIFADLLADGSQAMAMNDLPTALIWAQQAVEISRRLEREENMAWGLIQLGQRYMDLDDVEPALAAFTESDAVLRELELEKGLPSDVWEWSSLRKADVANAQGRHEEAKTHARDSLRLFEENGDRWSSFYPLISMGKAYLALSEFAQAREFFLEARRRADERGSAWYMAESRYFQGKTEYRQGELDSALALSYDSIREAHRIPDRNIIAANLDRLALIGARQGQVQRAARLAGASAAMWARQKRKPLEDATLDTLLPGWRERPDRDTIQAAFDDGQALSTDEAVAYALGEEADGNR